MKQFTVVLAFLLCAVVGQAQVQYLKDKPAYIEKQADSLTQIYSKKLGLTPKQDLLFKTNIGDYLVLREEVEKKYKGTEKLNEFYKVSKKDSGSMSEVLTEQQFELYEKIKSSIQPIARL
ncbi:MAG: hypothetical protein VX226_00800 [Bacteroidota bacterium]|nr:hypothetical protein [Bacteroidota bacterium]